MFGLARYGAGVAANAFSVIYQKAEVHFLRVECWKIGVMENWRTERPGEWRIGEME